MAGKTTLIQAVSYSQHVKANMENDKEYTTTRTPTSWQSTEPCIAEAFWPEITARCRKTGSRSISRCSRHMVPSQRMSTMWSQFVPVNNEQGNFVVYIYTGLHYIAMETVSSLTPRINYHEWQQRLGVFGWILVTVNSRHLQAVQDGTNRDKSVECLT